jgi:hypothetical protein
VTSLVDVFWEVIMCGSPRRAAYRTVTAYGCIITGGYGMKLTTTRTVNRNQHRRRYSTDVNTAIMWGSLPKSREHGRGGHNERKLEAVGTQVTASGMGSLGLHPSP